MKPKIAVLITACLIIVQTFAFAQQVSKLNGKVGNAQRQPLNGATIYLRKAIDSTLVKTAITDLEGKFVIENLTSGDFKLTVVMLGYHTYKSKIFSVGADLVLDEIVMETNATLLKSVEISVQKPLVEQKIDRTVVNVDAMLTATGSTAMDVLEKSPGVLVDQNGGISLKGKSGVTIFIDDKPTYLSGSELENYLKSLNASAIDKIELMSNPPAKYDAAGNGGIINIKTKKNKVKGFNGGVILSYTQGKYGKTNNNANFNYRNNKLNAFANLGYTTANGFSDLDINRYFLNPSTNISPNFLQNSMIRRKSQSYSARVGVDYYASSNTTLGIGYTALINPGEEKVANVSKLFNARNELDSSIVALNSQDKSFNNGGVNFNLRHNLAQNKGEFTFDVDYLNYRTGNEQSFDNTSLLPNSTIKSKDLLTGDLPSKINIYSAKTDFSRPFKNGIKFETGLKTSYTTTDNIADYLLTKNGVTAPDYDKTNHFRYKEQINAVYGNLSRDYKRFAIQLGLRLENTISNGHQLGNIKKSDSTFKRDYTGLFPTAYFQYKLNSTGTHTLSLDYGRRIDRPYYQDLNPFISPLDKFTYYVGNPFLKPTYADNIQLTHSYKNFSTSLDYSRSIDQRNETIEIIDGIYYSRPANLGETITKGISFNGSLDFNKWLNFNVFARLTNIHTISSFYTGTLDTQGTFYFVRPTLQFKWAKDWTAQIDGAYQSEVTNSQFVVARKGRLNAAIAKKLSPATTIKLVGNDLFYTFVNRGVINNLANTTANFKNLSDTRTVVLSFSYRFGKALSDQRKHDANGAESESGRVKN